MVCENFQSVITTKTFIFLFLLLPYAVSAQFTISGRVRNHDDNQAVANVSVFLNNTTIGGKTADDGVFKLHDVKPGKYDLTVSIIGFGTYSQSITINNTNITLPEIYIMPKVIALNEVKIKPDNPAARQTNLELFKNEFLGTSDLAKECKLINPQLLDLDYDEKTKTLTGQSSDFLVIENNALGYRIKYLLSAFIQSNYDQNAKQFFYEGSVLFEELKGTPMQEEQWKKRREEVYGNSITHFLRAALNNNLGGEGFSVLRFLRNPERPADSIINTKIKLYSGSKESRDSLSIWIKKSKLPKLIIRQTPAVMTAIDMIAQTNKQGIYTFGCDYDALYIVYNNARQYNASALNHLLDKNNTSSTLVFFNSPSAYFDGAGTILNPGSLTYTGVWANRRLAELLPVNYEPPQTGPPIDSTLIRKIDTILKAYTSAHKIEKAYLHFDKPYYAAGDTIYFKGYVTDASLQPSTLSGVLYADLINSSDHICMSAKLKLKDGMAAGDFALPDTLKKGSYRLRAYTNLMRNNGENYFFDQYVAIVNTGKATPQAIPARAPANKNKSTTSPKFTSTAKLDVGFFPEGGNLVSGVPSELAFKAVAKTGLGAEITGTITDEQGQQAGKLSSQHLGMGVVNFMPVAGKKYKANITYADSTYVFDLPKPDDSGYYLNVDNTDSLSLRIDITAGPQNHQAQVNLIAQSAGIVYDYTGARLVNNHFTTTIPKDRFPSGILQLTLFSTTGEPMNERLVFINNHDQLNLKLETEKAIYHAREKVKINIKSANSDNHPAPGSFSVAVINASVVPADEDRESTILSHLLLTSDLKGYVEAPNYYFTGKNKNAAADLDALMLTQGYHRFEWRPILNQKIGADVFQPENKISITGRITNTAGKPIPHGRVSLVSVSNVFFAVDTVADEQGRFIFEHLPMIDSMRYMIQAADKNVRKNTAIILDNANPPKAAGNKNKPDGIIEENEGLKVYLQVSKNFHQEQLKYGLGKHTITLKEVVVKETKNRKYLKHSENLNGPGAANDVITADQIPPGCPIFKDCIVGHLHGIQYVDGNFYYGMFPTLVLLDGMEIEGNIAIVMGKVVKKSEGGSSQADVLNSLNVNDIASVEIITDASLAAMYGERGAGGVIIITTKTFGDVIAGANNFEPKYAYYSPVLYYKARVFYSPVYDPPKTNTPFTDLRTTIYWNPDIVTDKNGNATFEFFNADTKGNYRIVVEGIDDNGHLGRRVAGYKVE
jgi:TonB-dependent SusC/RagA subfamily outer membrane receptor